jgi:catechol 2,3-dioxygenase-like lactoylglutathione lyase family enzyme
VLERVDRVLLVVRNRSLAADTFRDILGAEVVREDGLSSLFADRTVLRAGQSEFELLEPYGEGPVAAHLERYGEGIYASGFSTADPSALADRLNERGIRFREEAGQIFIEPDQTRGMRTVISRARDYEPVGLISWLYEVTNIVDDHKEAAGFYADIFGLDESRFVPISSDRWGYVGTLTMFNPPARLDRIELTQTTDDEKAMGRFYRKRGPSIYMCYAEAPDLLPIQARLDARGARYQGRSADPQPDGLFIHPSALHGMLVGISRSNLAWTWSGRPELARS